MIWYIVITFFVLLVTWILVGPVILKVDTETSKYLVTLPGIFTVRMVPSDKMFNLTGWIVFIPFRFDPFKTRSRKKRVRKVQKKSVESKRFRPPVRNMLRAFRIRRMKMDIDTDDYMLNAWLVPAFSAVNSYRNIDLHVNFEGNLALEMDIRTRLGAIAWLMMINRKKK